jgi:DnaJ-class molecular chaperone
MNPPEQCLTCDGKGKLIFTNPEPSMTIRTTCPKCNGSGKRKEATVQVPGGWKPSTKLYAPKEERKDELG